MPVEVFCCYARKDQQLLQNMLSHLMPLERERLITVWSDVDINAGEEWEKEITEHLNTAQIILLLVSPDFMMSEYAYSIEMKRAIERHKQGEASVIPIILRWVSWQGTPLGQLQALPKDAKPVKSWQDEDEAFYNVAEGIRKVVDEFISKSRLKNRRNLTNHSDRPANHQLDKSHSANHDTESESPQTIVEPSRVFKDTTALRKAMHKTFNLSDFKLLCSDLGVNYDDLEGEMLEVRMQSLIDHFRRRKRYQELVQQLLKLRPELADDL